MTELLAYGSKGKAVKRYQQSLIALGYPLPAHGADGHLGPETLRATKLAWEDFGDAAMRDIPEDLVRLVMERHGDQVLAVPIDHGAEGSHVIAYQAALNRALQLEGEDALILDGFAGDLVVDASAFAASMYGDTFLRRVPEELVEILAREVDEKRKDPAPALAGVTLTEFGAWSGTSTFRREERDIAFMVEHGLNRLDLMINDFAASRRPTDFWHHSREGTLRIARLCADAGIRFNLTTWVMPHSGFIKGMVEYLVPLMAELETLGQVPDLIFDCEEPWTKAKSVRSYDAAAKMIEEGFAERRFEMGCSGIGYVSKTGAFSKLARRCDFTNCQAYQLHVDGAPGKFYDRYLRFFGRPVKIGLAAYPQKRTPSSGLGDRMAVHVEDVRRNTDASSVIYWSLGWIRKKATAREFLKGVAGG